MLTKWLGVLEAVVVLSGLGGLFTGLYLLPTRPLPGVVAMLASLTLLASSLAKLGEAQEVRQRCGADRDSNTRRRVRDFDL